MRRFFRIVALITLTAFVLATVGVVAQTAEVATANDKEIDDGNYLLIDFDKNNAQLTSNELSPPENVIRTDEQKNNYMEIKPGWLNWGYMFKTPLPKNGGDIVVSFDFAGQGLTPNYYTLALSERATEKGDDVYHQFGLLKVAPGGNFMVAGSYTSGMTYEENKWYNYRIVFNLISGSMEVTITDKQNPDNKATFKGSPSTDTPLSPNYGNSIPERNYDNLKFGCGGTLLIDNIQVEESRAQVLSYGVETEHVGNMFDLDDQKKMTVSMKNILNSPIDAKITYEVYNEDDNLVESGNVGEFKIDPRATVKRDIVLGLHRYDAYKIYFIAEGKNAETGETFKVKNTGSMLSVVNKFDQSKKPNPMTAVNVPFIYEDTWPMFKEIIQQAGISAMRKDFTWYMTEDWLGAKGVYKEDVPEYSHFEDAVNSGIGNLAILLATNPLYSADGTFNTPYTLWGRNTPEMWKAYENYVEYVSKAYKDKVTYWEILNEPNGTVSAELYVKLMKTVYPIIKKNDPDSIVLGLCTASMPWSWIESVLGLLAEEGNWYMDVITVHPYDFDTGEYRTKIKDTLDWSIVFRDKVFEDKMTRLKEVMDKYGCDVPIHLTEVAATSTPQVVSMKRQGADFVHTLAITEEQQLVDKIYWYCLENPRARGDEWTRVNDTEANFGLVGYQGDKVPLAAKPAYLALAAYNDIIYDAQPVDKIIDGYTRAYHFKRSDGKQVVMLWCDEGSDNIALDLGVNEVEIFDVYSNSEGKLKSSSGKFSFTPNFEPIYIVGDFNKFKQAPSVISTNTSFVSAVLDDTVSFNIEDKLNRDLKVVATGTPYAVVKQNTNVKNGKGKLVVNTTDGSFEEEPVTVKIYNGNDMVYYSKYFINIKDTAINVKYVQSDDMTDESRRVINFSVTNETAGRTMTGEVSADFSSIGGKLEKRRIYDLKPGETKTVYLNVPSTPYIKSVEATAKVDFGKNIVLETPISAIRDMEVAYNNTGIKDASVFDGKYPSLGTFAAEDELAAASFKDGVGPDWGGPDDCSFRGTLLWDEEKLYILCDVKDDTFYQKETGELIWQGDGLQMGFQDADMLGEGIAFDHKAFCEIGVALSGDKSEYYRWTVHPGTSMSPGRFENCDLKIERTNGRTIYKMAIPWTETVGRATVNEGDTMRFNIIANDNDGTGRRGFAVITKGIGEVKDAQLFGKIKLVK